MYLDLFVLLAFKTTEIGLRMRIYFFSNRELYLV